jgi:phage-related protein
MRVEFLTLSSGKSPIEEFFGELDEKTIVKIYSLIERLESGDRLVAPHAKKLQGYDFWELRVNSQRGAVRVFYAYYTHDVIVLISGFIKKTQKTPRRELDKAASYLKQAEVLL